MYNVIGIKEYQLVNIERKSNQAVLEANFEQKPKACPYCGGVHLHSKGKYVRKAKHLGTTGLESILHIHTHRYQCKCCQKSFIPELPGLKAYRQSTEPLRREIYQLHHEGVCSTSVAKMRNISAASVNRIYEQCALI